jgi:hypothetical protein
LLEEEMSDQFDLVGIIINQEEMITLQHCGSYHSTAEHGKIDTENVT